MESSQAADVEPPAPVALEENSVRSCTMSAAQVYERFEKLPAEQRKTIATWVLHASAEADPVVALPKTGDGAGRPERWRVLDVDTQRWRDMEWKPVRWVAVNSHYDSADALVRAAMALLNDVAVPLCFISNRYSSAREVLCVDVPVRYGLAMGFIRAQARASERELAGEEADNSEAEVRAAWLADGLSMDDYRSFALQLFSLRQERDPAFVLMVFRGTPDRVALLWMRDIHLASSWWCKGLLPASIESLYWPNYNHLATRDPPLEVCERPECGVCGGLVTDPQLLQTFVRHAGPWRTASKDAVNSAMKQLWTSTYEPRFQAALREMDGRMSDAEQATLRAQLVDQAESERPQVEARVERERRVAFKRCGRCRMARYCSNECQKGDWTRHGKYCVERKK